MTTQALNHCPKYREVILCEVGSSKSFSQRANSAKNGAQAFDTIQTALARIDFALADIAFANRSIKRPMEKSMGGDKFRFAYLLLSINPVQQCQHSRYDPALRLAVSLIPPRTQSVYFVEHDQTWRASRRLRKCLSECALALPYKSAEDGVARSSKGSKSQSYVSQVKRSTLNSVFNVSTWNSSQGNLRPVMDATRYSTHKYLRIYIDRTIGNLDDVRVLAGHLMIFVK